MEKYSVVFEITEKSHKMNQNGAKFECVIFSLVP